MSRPSQGTAVVHLEPWGPDDLPLLKRLLGDPVMMAHLGGPESPEKIAERHLRYQRLGDAGAGRMFKIVDDAIGDAAVSENLAAALPSRSVGSRSEHFPASPPLGEKLTNPLEIWVLRLCSSRI